MRIHVLVVWVVLGVGACSDDASSPQDMSVQSDLPGGEDSRADLPVSKDSRADLPISEDSRADLTADAAAVNTVSFTVDGNPSTFADPGKITFNYDQAMSSYKLSAQGTTGTTTVLLRVFLPQNLVAGTTFSTCSTSKKTEVLYIEVASGGAVTYQSAGASGTSCEIVVSSFGPVGSVIAGTFKAVVKNSSGVLHSLNNGVFSIVRGADQ